MRKLSAFALWAVVSLVVMALITLPPINQPQDFIPGLLVYLSEKLISAQWSLSSLCATRPTAD